jgi:hypothetical protein
LPARNARVAPPSHPSYLPVMPVAAVTRLRLRSVRFVPLLVVAAVRARRQALASEGCLAADTRAHRGFVFWTRTLWRDAAAAHRFARSGAHGAAMPKLQHWCDEASVVHFERDTLRSGTRPRRRSAATGASRGCGTLRPRTRATKPCLSFNV